MQVHELKGKSFYVFCSSNIYDYRLFPGNFLLPIKFFDEEIIVEEWFRCLRQYVTFPWSNFPRWATESFLPTTMQNGIYNSYAFGISCEVSKS